MVTKKKKEVKKVKKVVPVFPEFFFVVFLVRTAANCNVLMADLISLPVALQRVDREVPRNKNGNEIKDE